MRVVQVGAACVAVASALVTPAGLRSSGGPSLQHLQKQQQHGGGNHPAEAAARCASSSSSSSSLWAEPETSSSGASSSWRGTNDVNMTVSSSSAAAALFLFEAPLFGGGGGGATGHHHGGGLFAAVDRAVLPKASAEDARLLDELFQGGPEVGADPSPLNNPNDRPQQQRGRSEFELNLGRCIDVLRADFPEFFLRDLDFSIYTENIQVRDPTGVALKGLKNYKKVFAAIRFFRRVMIEHVDVTYRLRYDWGAKRIVVQWYSRWFARGSERAGHVDGVSHFYLNDRGFIYKHEIDRVMVNGQPLQPPYGVGAWLNPNGIPAMAMPMPEMAFFRTVARGLFSAGEEEVVVPPPVTALSTSTTGRDTTPSSAKKTANRRKSGDGKKSKNPLSRALSTCESIWDCDSPMECCDFVAFKMCCNGGVGIPNFMLPEAHPKPIPIPVENPNFPRPPGPLGDNQGPPY